MSDAGRTHHDADAEAAARRDEADRHGVAARNHLSDDQRAVVRRVVNELFDIRFTLDAGEIYTAVCEATEALDRALVAEKVEG